MKRCHSFIFKFMNFYIVAISMVTVFTFSGCIEEFEADIPEEDSHMLVVEGTIRSLWWNTFTLSRTAALHEYSCQVVTDAKVSVRGTDGSEYIANQNYWYYEYMGRPIYVYSGEYSCMIGMLNPDVEYYLHIETDGEIYETEPQKPLPTEKIADVRGVQNTPESSIDVLVTPEAPFEANKVTYYSWTYDETWEVHPEYTTILFFDTEKMDRVYKYNQFPERGWKDSTVMNSTLASSQSYEGQHIQKIKLYDIGNGNERLFHRYSGLIHQRAISKAEYEYELARRKAASEMGGLFTPLPSTLPSNIHCLTSKKHAIGFVGCSLNTSEYRFFLNADDFSIYRPRHKDARLWVINPSETDYLILVEKGMFLCAWEDERQTKGILRTAWVYERQLDVRFNGAYTEEPYFWSLQENVSY